MNSSLTNNVLLFFITKYNFKAAVWYLQQSYLHYIHWNSKYKSQLLCLRDKEGFKIENVRPTSALLQLSSFRLSFFLCQRVEREGLPLAWNLHFLLPGSLLGSCLTETDQQIDQHSNQACSEWVLSLCFLDNFRPQIVHL